MTIQVANTTNTHTLPYALARLNELAFAMSNKVITVESNTTSGNAIVNGSLYINTLFSNAISGGNSSVTFPLNIGSNVVINTGNNLTVGNSTVNSNLTNIQLIVGNAIVNTSQISIGSNLVILPNSINVGNSTVNLNITSTELTLNGTKQSIINTQSSGTSEQIVDSFSKSSYRSAEYILSISDNSSNGYQTSKLIMLHDNSDAHISEYGVIYSNNHLGTFSANANTTHCRLLMTPNVSNTQIKGIRTIIIV